MNQSQSIKLEPVADSSAQTDPQDAAQRSPGMAARRLRLIAKDTAPHGTGASARMAELPVSSIWEPAQPSTSPVPTTSEVLHRTRPPQDLAPALEAAIVATLTRPLRADEGHQTGNANRERELGELFAQLDGIQAHHLGRRLDLNRPDDALAQAFQRLIVDRRQRLRAFIADTRRRHAIRKS